jgi:hypothetical protein
LVTAQLQGERSVSFGKLHRRDANVFEAENEELPLLESCRRACDGQAVRSQAVIELARGHVRGQLCEPAVAGVSDRMLQVKDCDGAGVRTTQIVLANRQYSGARDFCPRRDSSRFDGDGGEQWLQGRAWLPRRGCSEAVAGQRLSAVDGDDYCRRRGPMQAAIQRSLQGVGVELLSLERCLQDE